MSATFGPAAAAVASVAASTSAVTLFAAVTTAPVFGRMIYNDSPATLYAKYGAAASSTDHTVAIPPGGYFEAPTPVYQGQVTGAWSAASGSARCTAVI